MRITYTQGRTLLTHK